MARGYPDFFGYQTFFSYGTPVAEIVSPLTIVAGATGDPLSLTGKGRSYGGFMTFTAKAADVGLFTIEVIVDGNSLGAHDPAGMVLSGTYADDSYFFRINDLSYITDYFFGITYVPNWSWGQTVICRFDLTACANNIDVYLWFYWARVQ